MITDTFPISSAGVVGLGRAGRALAASLASAGIHVVPWEGRRAFAGEAPPEGLHEAAVLFLAVPDGAVTATAEVLARTLALGERPPVLHLSGALPAAALAPLALAGFPVGVFHPLQSFPDHAGGPYAFRGIAVSIEGDEPALRAARSAASALGARTVEVPSEARPLYHLAAVLAANGTVALLGAAIDAMAAAGLTRGDAREALAPLARAAFDRALREGPRAALSGPVARGDRETLERHRAAIRAWDPGRLSLYDALVAEQERLLARPERE